MVNSEAGSSSEAPRPLGGDYHVFLSFRGADTRHGFTDFLYHGLIDAGVRVFRDEEELRFGEVIGGNLLRAIDDSMIYIPIFSRTYASSKWCLRELVHIVDNVSRSKGKKTILPIFLDVEPEDVKLKTSRYSDAFLEHANKFPDEVEAWRKALAEVDEIKGWNVKKDQSQAKIVESVIEKVLEKLETRRKSLPEYVVGLDDRVEHLIELSNLNHRNMRLIAIYGMGGIGKTTIAKIVFNRLSSHFGKCCSFLENVRENSSEEGIVKLQKQLLSDIAVLGSLTRVKGSEHGMQRIGVTLSPKKVLVVLDDVDNQEQIKKLIGNFSLHPGSRIIITTRNLAVLQTEGFEGETLRYEMLKMDDGPALQLFCRHAFGRDVPPDDFRALSSHIVSTTGGLPLAVEVIASLLKGKDQDIWGEMLLKLRKVPEKKILEKLRISYDDLDKHHKQIFLDIACFFFNENKTDAIYMWTECQFYPKGGIEVLVGRCLVKILDNDKFWIHDQLIALGRQIVREESQDDLGKQSRLWITEEALEIIGTEERKDMIQALEINKGRGFTKIINEEFERLQNLRFLKLHNGTFVGNFAKCRSKLRWMSWHPSPQHFRADNMYLDRLVVFKLGENRFADDSKAWDLIKRAQNLKVLSLTNCHGITTIPDFSKCLDLERLTLAFCDNLKRVESFIGNLQSLINLEINECRGLQELPEEVGALVKLRYFSLQGCSGLRELPGSLGNLISLMELDLSKTKIRGLPKSIGRLNSLRFLRFAIYSHLENHVWHLPSGISTLVNLEELDLSRHNLGEIPLGIGELPFLRILNLSCTSINGIPGTISRLHRLQTLNLSECHSIQVLPDLPTSLTRVVLESMSLLLVPNLWNLTNLVELQLHDYSWNIEGSNLLTGCHLRWIRRLYRLKRLSLNLLNVPAPPKLASLSYLEELNLYSLDLVTLKQLPPSLLKLDLRNSSIRCGELLRLRNLSTLMFSECEVEDIPLEEVPRLEKLTVVGCKRLQKLSIPWQLRELKKVHMSECPELDEIQVVGLSISLESFYVDKCKSLSRIWGLSYLKNLVTLNIRDCRVLTDVQGLDELECLKYSEVFKCPSLRMMIDAHCTNRPDEFLLNSWSCGDNITFEPFYSMPNMYYDRAKILQNTSNKINQPFTIIFVLGAKKYSEGSGFVGGIERQIQNATPGLVTYEGLITDVKGFGFHLERMWYKAPAVDSVLLVEIKSDEEVNDMMPLASYRGFVRLFVEGGFDGELGKATNQVEDQRDLSSVERLFTVIYHLGVTKPSGESEFVGGIRRENENVTPDSVTYRGLIADVKGFGFRLKRMRYETPGEYCDLLIEINSDEQVERMVQLASKRGSIHLYVEGGLDSEWEGEYTDEIMEMLREEWATKTDVYSDEDWAEWAVLSPDEDSNSASAGESETDGTSSIDDFQSEPGNAECSEAIGNWWQMRDGTIVPSGNGAGGKTMSMENRMKEEDENGEPAEQNDVVQSSCQRCKGVEYHESSCKTATELEDEGVLSSVKRDRTVETDRVPAKTGRGSGTGRASNLGTDIAERGRGRGIASSSRNSKDLRSGREAASTSGKGKASNSGSSISSISRNSTTLSSERGRGPISGKCTTFSSGRNTIFGLGRGRGPSSRRGTANMSASSSSGRGIASSSRSSSTSSTGRGRGSTSGKDTIVSLGRGTTKMGASLRSKTDKGSSSAKTQPQTSSS